MGHESQIEPWLPLNQVLLAGFGTDRLRCEQAMNTADRRKPKPLGHSAQQPRSWRGRSEQISFDQVGCEARKIPASGEISFLTSSFIEQTGAVDGHGSRSCGLGRENGTGIATAGRRQVHG